MTDSPKRCKTIAAEQEDLPECCRAFWHAAHDYWDDWEEEFTNLPAELEAQQKGLILKYEHAREEMIVAAETDRAKREAAWFQRASAHLHKDPDAISHEDIDCLPHDLVVQYRAAVVQAFPKPQHCVKCLERRTLDAMRGLDEGDMDQCDRCMCGGCGSEKWICADC